MFLVKHKICKCWLHYGAASIETFLKGASNKKSLGTAAITDIYSIQYILILTRLSIKVHNKLFNLRETKLPLENQNSTKELSAKRKMNNTLQRNKQSM